MANHWTAETVLELARSYQPACVLAAAVDLDVFSALAAKPQTAGRLARVVNADRRALPVLLDALVALELLGKRHGRYSVPAAVAKWLTRGGARSVLPMAQHQANCLRRWAQLPPVLQTGRPVSRRTSIRGEDADRAAFIGAMHTVSGPVAGQLVRAFRRKRIRHLLDVGGASGTWTIAFLRAHPRATATLFDQLPVIPLARQRLADAGLSHRVRLVGGDFAKDPLPPGADFAWVSAIAHQNSRAQNRDLFAKVRRALVPGGTIAIRDILMNPARTAPPAGALFAINMLVSTEGGGTYTWEEIRADLRAAGFATVTRRRRDPGMNSIVVGR